MAGITNPPFRLIAKECGSALTTSEEIAAVGLCIGNARTLQLLDFYPQERPIAMQLLGSEPSTLAEAARILEDRAADIVDLNMGCPVPKIVRKGEGAALMQNPQQAALIFRAMRKAVGIPLTIKIRCGWDDAHKNAAEIAHIAESEGVDAITVHPRTRAQQFGGKARWEVIGEVVEAVSIPVTGNGDVLSLAGARSMISATGCQSVMIGRGALGQPWIFDESFERLSPEAQHEHKSRVINRHADLIEAGMPERLALIQLKKHLAWYTSGLDGSAAIRRAIYEASDRNAVRQLFAECWSNTRNTGSGTGWLRTETSGSSARQ
jgi:nifR3 family TIM-barrel protein